MLPGMSMDAVFTALANPVRRRLLTILIDGPKTAGALSDEFELSRPAISEHLQVLRKAQLVHDTQSGRERHYQLTAQPFTELQAWLRPFDQYWRARIDALSAVLDDEP